MNERWKIVEYIDKTMQPFLPRIKDGIEKRKGKTVLCIKDKAGNIVPNAKVKIVQTKHDFKFGANLFMLEQLETEEKNIKYKENFSNLFNMATLPFYWNTLEPQEGELRYDKNSSLIYRRPAIDICMEFCQENGIEPREHGLMYAGMFPKWLKEYSTEEVKKRIEKRYKEIAERYADKIPCIEVTNEMFWWWDDGDGSAPIDFYYSEEFLPFAYELAEKYFPNNTLSINDMPAQTFGAAKIVPRFLNDKTTPYYLQIEKLLRMGYKIDEIGVQYHMFYDRAKEEENTKNYYSIEHIFRALDLFARLGKPLQFTEITIPAYSNESEDEEIQAEIIKRLYTVWFSHPAVSQIIYWNLPDGYAHGTKMGDMTAGENRFYGGLLRHDMSKKPAYFAIEKLIKEEWHTDEESTTDTNGEVAFTGFYGEYEISIEDNGQVKQYKIHLEKDKGNKFECYL